MRINLSEILYIEGSRNYVKIVTETRPLLVLITLKRMENLLPPAQFVRVHKSYIVSLNHVLAFDSDEVDVARQTLPIGSQYRGVLEQKVMVVHEKRENSGISEEPELVTAVHRVAS
ncbi:MAG TPA: LytTR family DNA-binding domain-containing protein [Lacibacter sp.]|nr:LytTR family DNA-binding domain-containing protein [Lacibacter sp.]